MLDFVFPLPLFGRRISTERCGFISFQYFQIKRNPQKRSVFKGFSWLPELVSNFRLPSMCEQSAVDTAKHSRLGRSYIRFRYSLFSPLTRKNSHSGCFFSVNYRLRSSVAERGIALRDVAGWIQSKRAKRKTIRLDGFLFGSPCWARTSDIMINSHALYRLS